MRPTRILTIVLSVVAAHSGWSQTGYLATVISKPVSKTVELPGEFSPYLSVALHARVAGYVERILVDRGSVVKQGELVAELAAPELRARLAEAEYKLQAADAERVQAEAQLAAARATHERLKKAATVPGSIAGIELIQAEEQVAAAQALVRGRQEASRAAEAVVRAQKDVEGYLRITAPFDGVVTDRLVHPGALVGPGNDSALVVIQQISRLRLVVAVPEQNVGGIVAGGQVGFRVPAYPERTFRGVISRPSHALDQKARTMAVELDVANADGSLAPGMYPIVQWPVRTTRPSLLVPRTSVVATTERTFVVRDNAGRAEWVDVTKGAPDGDLVEVLGSLRPGDKVVRRATDELREGTALQASAP